MLALAQPCFPDGGNQGIIQLLGGSWRRISNADSRSEPGKAVDAVLQSSPILSSVFGSK